MDWIILGSCALFPFFSYNSTLCLYMLTDSRRLPDTSSHADTVTLVSATAHGKGLIDQRPPPQMMHTMRPEMMPASHQIMHPRGIGFISHFKNMVWQLRWMVLTFLSLLYNLELVFFLQFPLLQWTLEVRWEQLALVCVAQPLMATDRHKCSIINVCYFQ